MACKASTFMLCHHNLFIQETFMCSNTPVQHVSFVMTTLKNNTYWVNQLLLNAQQTLSIKQV